MHKCVSVFCLFDGKYSQDQRLKQQYRCPMRTNLWRGLFYSEGHKTKEQLQSVWFTGSLNSERVWFQSLWTPVLGHHTHTQASRSILFSRTTSVHPPVSWFTVLITIPVIVLQPWWRPCGSQDGARTHRCLAETHEHVKLQNVYSTDRQIDDDQLWLESVWMNNIVVLMRRLIKKVNNSQTYI